MLSHSCVCSVHCICDLRSSEYSFLNIIQQHSSAVCPGMTPCSFAAKPQIVESIQQQNKYEMKLSWSEWSSFHWKHKHCMPTVLQRYFLSLWLKENIEINDKYLWNYKLQAFNSKKIFHWNKWVISFLCLFFGFFFSWKDKDRLDLKDWVFELWMAWEFYSSYRLQEAPLSNIFIFFCVYVLILVLLYLSLHPKNHQQTIFFVKVKETSPIQGDFSTVHAVFLHTKGLQCP